MNIAAEWFQGRVCLMLIDDVWCKNGLDFSVADVLSGLWAENKSRIAFTTRDVTLRSNVKIRFHKRDLSNYERMLLFCAGLNSTQVEKKEISAMEMVLKMTHGLPIALNVIGSRARFWIEEGQVDTSHIWSTVLREYENPDPLLSGMAFHNDQNETVMNVLLLSLDMIQNEKTERKY